VQDACQVAIRAFFLSDSWENGFERGFSNGFLIVPLRAWLSGAFQLIPVLLKTRASRSCVSNPKA